MPAYVVTVLTAYVIYHFRHAGPNYGHTWFGLFRNLTLTQIYTFNYMPGYLHQGLTHDVEPRGGSLVLPAASVAGVPAVVILCRRQWRPTLLLLGIAGLALITPAWLLGVHLVTSIPDGARLAAQPYLIWSSPA